MSSSSDLASNDTPWTQSRVSSKSVSTGQFFFTCCSSSLMYIGSTTALYSDMVDHTHLTNTENKRLSEYGILFLAPMVGWWYTSGVVMLMLVSPKLLPRHRWCIIVVVERKMLALGGCFFTVVVVTVWSFGWCCPLCYCSVVGDHKHGECNVSDFCCFY